MLLLLVRCLGRRLHRLSSACSGAALAEKALSRTARGARSNRRSITRRERTRSARTPPVRMAAEAQTTARSVSYCVRKVVVLLIIRRDKSVSATTKQLTELSVSITLHHVALIRLLMMGNKFVTVLKTESTFIRFGLSSF